MPENNMSLNLLKGAQKLDADQDITRVPDNRG